MAAKVTLIIAFWGLPERVRTCRVTRGRMSRKSLIYTSPRPVLEGADHDKASTSDEGVEPDADAGHRSVKEKVVLKEWMLNAWKGRCETKKEECIQYCIFITKPRDAKVMTNFELVKRYEREFGCKVSMRSRKRNPGVGPGSQKDGENKQWVRASLHPIDYLQDHEERLRAISAAESHFDRFITRLVQEETFTRADMEAMALE